MWCDKVRCDNMMWCHVMKITVSSFLYSAQTSLSSCSIVSLGVYSTALERWWVLEEHNSEKTNEIYRQKWKHAIYSPKPHGISLNLRCWPLSLRALMCLYVYSTGVEPRWVQEEHNSEKTNKICQQKVKPCNLLTKTTSSFSQSSLLASLSSCSVVPVYVLNSCWALVSSTMT